MSSDINPNVVTASVIQGLIKNFSSEMISTSTAAIKRLFEKHVKTFDDYLSSVSQNVLYVKTLIDKDKPTLIENIYVNLFFKSGGERFTDEAVMSLIRDRRRIVIQATGGAGKTIFMKYAWATVFRNPLGKIPIFLELRRLNEMSDVELEVSIFHFIREQREGLPESVFRDLCQEGTFIFFLDGFDEVKLSRRDEVERRINNLARRYRDCAVVVSSRPDERLNAWNEFRSFVVQTLSIEQVRDLIDVIEFNKPVKSKFLKQLNNDFYKQHESFLSIPLLAIIMLITFETYADVPSDLHLFYDHAYTALFHYHDSLKESYNRERKSGLAIDKFRRIFAIFCLFTYHEEKFEFTETEIKSVLFDSAKADSVDLSIDDYLFDLTQTVCLMQREGLSYTFSHRSFQEYFAAFAVCFIFNEEGQDFADAIFKRYLDNCLLMAYRMNRTLIQNSFLLPKIKVISDRISQSSSVEERLERLGIGLTVYLAKVGRAYHLDGIAFEDDSRFSEFAQLVGVATGQDIAHASISLASEAINRIEAKHHWMFEDYDPQSDNGERLERARKESELTILKATFSEGKLQFSWTGSRCAPVERHVAAVFKKAIENKTLQIIFQKYTVACDAIIAEQSNAGLAVRKILKSKITQKNS